MVACGQTEAEKAADQAQRNYLKQYIRSTNALLEQRLGNAHIPIDTASHFAIIDGMKGKELKEHSDYIKETMDDLRKTAGILY